MNKVMRYLFLSIILLSFSCPASVNSNEKNNKTVQSAPTLVSHGVESGTVYAGFFEFEGYHEISDDGAKTGYGYDFLQMMARYTDFTYEYVGYNQSWSDMKDDLLLPETDANHIDLVTSASTIDDSNYIFSKNDIGTKSTILSVKAGNNNYSDGDYSNIHVGLISGSTGTNGKFDDYMVENGFTYYPYYFDSATELATALQDGMDSSGHVIEAIVTSSLRKTINEWVLEEISPSDFYVMFSADKTDLKDQVDVAIAKMDAADPSWRTTLLNKYYATDSGENVNFTQAERNYLTELKKSGKVLKATFDPDRAPYSYYVDGVACGIIPTLFKEVARRMDLAYEIIPASSREEYKELIYPNEDGTHKVDLVLDGVNDFYLAESNGYKISDPYLTNEIALVTSKTLTSEPTKVAIPNYAVISPALLDICALKEVTYTSTMDEAIELVKSEKVEGAYLPNASAKHFVEADPTNSISYTIVNGYSDSYVISVCSSFSHLLIGAINRTVNSLSTEYVSGVVAENEVLPIPFSLIGFIYDYPWAVALFAVMLILIACSIVVVVIVSTSRKRAKERFGELSRFVDYICLSDDTVAEVSLSSNTIKRYLVENGKTIIKEEYCQFREYPTTRDDTIFEKDTDLFCLDFTKENLQEAISKGQGLYFEARCLDKSCEPRNYSYFIQPVEVSQKHPDNFILYRRDIDETRKEEEQKKKALSDALINAESSSEAKGNFLSSMSHEIRTPLNAIIGYLSMAKDSTEDKEKIEHYLDNSSLAAKHLLNVINNVLDMSSIESGRLKIASDPFDLKSLLSTISSIYYSEASRRGIQFALQIESLTHEHLIGDSLRVNQVLMNLLSNAMKFTSKGGLVSLNVTEVLGEKGKLTLRFKVSDTGIGMSKEFLKKIFTPFEQESASTARNYGGSGLGLSICKNMVNLMGGNIDVTSVEGKGSVFTVAIPFGYEEDEVKYNDKKRDFSKIRALVVDDEIGECQYATSLFKRLSIKSDYVSDGEAAVRKILAREEAGRPYDLCLMDWKMKGLSGLETAKKIREALPHDLPIIIASAYDVSTLDDEAKKVGVEKVISKPLFESSLFDLLVNTFGSYIKEDSTVIQSFDFTGIKVLLAEDNEMNVEIATDVLTKRGILVSVAHNGEEAVKLFTDNGPNYFDAILMDIQMPRIDGYEATRLIRNSSSSDAKLVPIIAMTADAFASDVSKALSAGMNDHVSKPIDVERLFQVLSEQIHKRRKKQ